jgi:triosephosphate isomerase
MHPGVTIESVAALKDCKVSAIERQAMVAIICGKTPKAMLKRAKKNEMIEAQLAERKQAARESTHAAVTIASMPVVDGGSNSS